MYCLQNAENTIVQLAGGPPTVAVALYVVPAGEVGYVDKVTISPYPADTSRNTFDFESPLPPLQPQVLHPHPHPMQLNPGIHSVDGTYTRPGGHKTSFFPNLHLEIVATVRAGQKIKVTVGP